MEKWVQELGASYRFDNRTSYRIVGRSSMNSKRGEVVYWRGSSRWGVYIGHDADLYESPYFAEYSMYDILFIKQSQGASICNG